MKKICTVFIVFCVTFFVCANEYDDYKIGISYINDGFFEESERIFESLSENPKDPLLIDKVNYYLGISRLNLAKYDAAVSCMAKAYKGKNQVISANAGYYLAILYQLLENFNESDRVISGLAKESYSPQQKEKIAYMTVINKIKLSSTTQAVESIKDYINSGYKENKNELLKELINYLIEIKDFNKSIIYLEDLLTEPGLNSVERETAYLNLITIFFKTEAFQEAVKYFEKNPITGNDEVLKIVSESYYKIGNKPKSISILQSVKNKSEDITRKIILTELELGDDKDALEIIGDNKTFFDIKADIFYKSGDLQAALQTILKLDINTLSDHSLGMFLFLVNELNSADGYARLYNNKNVFERMDIKLKNNALYKSSEYFYNNGMLKESAELLGMWIREFEDDRKYPAALYMCAVIEKRAGNYDKSLAMLTKIQKLKKNDEIYNESFVEKGEVYFLLKEYREAISCYETYLRMKGGKRREKEVLLQTGNAFYNIKEYGRAFTYFENYRRSAGVESVDIYNKIADSLIKGNDYSGAINYFADKTNCGEYSEYVTAYSHYRLKNFDALIKYADSIKGNVKYFEEISYLILMAYEETGRNNEIISYYDLYSSVSKKNENKDIRIDNIFFNAMVKAGLYDKSKTVYHKDSDIVKLYSGEIYYKNLRLKDAEDTLSKIDLSFKNTDLGSSDIYKLLNIYNSMNNIPKASRVSDFLMREGAANDELIVIRHEILYKQRNFTKIKELAGLAANKNLKNFIENTAGEKINIKAIIDQLNGRDVNSLIDQYILLFVIKYLNADKDYGLVTKIMSKINHNNKIDPEIRFYEAQSLFLAGSKNEAKDKLLKIIYLYTENPFWIYKSYILLKDIYSQDNETQKIEKITSIVEEKYFKIANVDID